MDTTEFGILAMVAFWASAVGGVAFAISWSKAKSRNPVSKKLLLKSLEERLENGEIGEEEFQRRRKQITQTEKPGNDGRG